MFSSLSSGLQSLFAIIKALGLTPAKIVEYITVVGPALAEFTAKVQGTSDLRPKILAAFDLLRVVAPITPTGADDAVLALLDKVGDDAAADLIDRVLRRLYPATMPGIPRVEYFGNLETTSHLDDSEVPEGVTKEQIVEAACMVSDLLSTAHT